MAEKKAGEYIAYPLEQGPTIFLKTESAPINELVRKITSYERKSSGGRTNIMVIDVRFSRT